MRLAMGYLCFALYAATIPLANWMISNVGQCFPNGPCVVPVGFGFFAPSGVLVVGATLVLRDAVHSMFGTGSAVGAVLIGTLMSAVLSPPSLVIASAMAFLLAETSDLMVYIPLRKKRAWFAVIASGIVGSIADSAVFLWLAFGSLDMIAGQVIGKLYASVAIGGFLFVRSRK